MVNYRRCKIKGGSYFFTVALQDRNSRMLIEHFDLLQNSIHEVKQLYPFKMNAFVVLPDHLHTIWTLPKEDDNFSILEQIKGLFTRKIKSQEIILKKNSRDEYNLWQKRFWEHLIRNQNDMNNHVNYIHYNPVKHGWVARVEEWPYSSFHGYVQRKIISRDWGGIAEGEGDFGK